MFAVLKSQRFSLQVLLPIIGFIPFLSFFIVPGSDQLNLHNAQGFSYTLFRDLVSGSPNLLIFGSYLLVVLYCIVLFFVNIRYEILGQRSLILSYFYLFVVCIPMMNMYLHPASLGGFFLFLGLLSMFGIYQKEKPLSGILNAGILFGLSTLLYPPMLLFAPIFWFAIARMKRPAWRDFVVMILGFLIPVCLYGTYLFLNDQLLYQWISITQWFEIRHTWPPPFPGNSLLNLIWVIWLILLLPVALAGARSRKDAGRRVISVLLQFLWMGPVIILLFEKISIEIWGLLALPIAVLFSLIVMNSRNRWLSNLLVLSMIVFFLWFQIDRLL